MSTVTRFTPAGFGWQRDLPDPRDFALSSDVVSTLLSGAAASCPVPSQVDLRGDGDGVYVLAAEDQGSFPSASAHACIGLVEYFERRARGLTFDADPTFLYAVSQRLSVGPGSPCVGLRTTWKALCRYGCPPRHMVNASPQTVAALQGLVAAGHRESEFATDRSRQLLADPTLFGFTDAIRGMCYFRLDRDATGRALPKATRVESESPAYSIERGDVTLSRVRACLAAGLPVVLGFSVPRSLTQDPLVPFRPAFDSYQGGQAVLVVGYDDDYFVGNPRRSGNRGALLFRANWGVGWGEAGFGWIPYAMLRHGQAVDVWSAVAPHWIESKLFSCPNVCEFAG